MVDKFVLNDEVLSQVVGGASGSNYVYAAVYEINSMIQTVEDTEVIYATIVNVFLDMLYSVRTALETVNLADLETFYNEKDRYDYFISTIYREGSDNYNKLMESLKLLMSYVKKIIY